MLGIDTQLLSCDQCHEMMYPPILRNNNSILTHKIIVLLCPSHGPFSPPHPSPPSTNHTPLTLLLLHSPHTLHPSPLLHPPHTPHSPLLHPPRLSLLHRLLHLLHYPPLHFLGVCSHHSHSSSQCVQIIGISVSAFSFPASPEDNKIIGVLQQNRTFVIQ